MEKKTIFSMNGVRIIVLSMFNEMNQDKDHKI